MKKLHLTKMQQIPCPCCGKAGKLVRNGRGGKVIEHITPRKEATKEIENFMPDCGQKLDITSK